MKNKDQQYIIIEKASENNNSCVLLVKSRSGTILLTGDIEKQAEFKLLAAYRQRLNADILIAPHHGSNSSSTLAFLRQVNPNTVLIPAGYRNRFGFPHEQVLKRYRKINADWLNVAEQGALAVTMQEGKITVSGYRDSHGKYWNQ